MISHEVFTLKKVLETTLKVKKKTESSRIEPDTVLVVCSRSDVLVGKTGMPNLVMWTTNT